MKIEDKQLLLQDLCGRLPYGVKVDIPDLFVSSKNNIEVLKEIFCGDDGEFRCNNSGMLIKHVKPYLFPLSSMTEEQQIELTKFVANGIMDENIVYDWYNKNHFDYRGLIPMDLANDATNLNIY
jgi:hypothetical protein